MRETREIAMEETVPKASDPEHPASRLARDRDEHVARMLFAGNALAQQIAVTGTVTSAGVARSPA